MNGLLDKYPEENVTTEHFQTPVDHKESFVGKITKSSIASEVSLGLYETEDGLKMAVHGGEASVKLMYRRLGETDAIEVTSLKGVDGAATQPSQEQLDQLEEIEYCYFLKLDDFEQLKKAKYYERQEQWGRVFAEDKIENKLRVRRVSDSRGGQDKFILTVKVDFPGTDGDWEMEEEVERMHFDIVKSCARSGMIKDRYFFPVDGTELVYEVDVFRQKDGTPVPWVKVDLEVPQRTDNLPPIPIEYVEAVLNQPDQQTAEERSLVKGLFNNHYVVKP